MSVKELLKEPFKHDRMEFFVLGMAVGFLLFSTVAFRSFGFEGYYGEDNRLSGSLTIEKIPDNVEGYVYVSGWISHFDVVEEGKFFENYPTGPALENLINENLEPEVKRNA